DCVEVACWPRGRAERRYAGVTHIDVADLSPDEAARIRDLMDRTEVAISALGYYPNPLAPDRAEAEVYAQHLRKVILAAETLDIGLVNTFVGRDPALTVDENWPRMLEVWRPLLRFAEDHGVSIAIENCPMYFTRDEWPGGKNLATSPAIWRRLFGDLPSPNLGLNYDPSHLVWQGMDYVAPITEFADHILHVHAKDARVDRARLNEVGILAHPLEYHTPKLPGLGDIAWGRFFSALSDTGYDGAVCIEVEDRAYEDTLERRLSALRQSGRYLLQYME
ncbi:MAG: sugar phosphate isomerase/epimerase, partial [Chloroflexi bacterium]|nr:sugar phosphate isomerase/epimerase [Chloroflexota bacterium]